ARERAGPRRIPRGQGGPATRRGTSRQASGPRQPDLAAAQRRGLVPAVHRRAVHGGPGGGARGEEGGEGGEEGRVTRALSLPEASAGNATAGELLRSAYD